MKSYILCVGNLSQDFAANNMKKTGLNGYVYNFSVDYISLIIVIWLIFINI